MTAPEGVTQVRYILGQGAQGSTAGQDGETVRVRDGDVPYTANDGTPGKPGRILSGTANVNAGTPISYVCGAGSPAGAYGAAVPEGADTTFGPNLTTANGAYYENGFTDIASGSVYGRSEVPAPADGTSDGPAAGQGGDNAVWLYRGRETTYDSSGKPTGSRPVYDRISTKTAGTPGAKGADGFIVLYWDTPSGS